MYCSVYVVYTVRGKVFRDRIAYNLLLGDAEELVRQQLGRGYTRIDITTYPAYPFRVGPLEETIVSSAA